MYGDGSKNKIVKIKPKLNYVFTYVGIIEH